MNFQIMSDKQIIEAICENLDKKRLSKKLSLNDLATKGGHNAQTYSNFVNQNKDIRLTTLIQILRGLGELESLQNLVEYKEPYSPLGKKVKLKKRVVKSNTNNKNIEWKD